MLPILRQLNCLHNGGLNDLLLFPEFPETQFELFEKLRGIDLSFVMCKKNKKQNLLLLRLWP